MDGDPLEDILTLANVRCVTIISSKEAATWQASTGK